MATLIEKRLTELFEIPRYLQPVETAWPNDHDESSRTYDDTVERRSTRAPGEEKPAAWPAS